MNFPVKQVSRRYVLVAFFMVVMFILVIAKAFYIMTAEKEFWMAVSDRFVKENVPVPPTRGNILADNGEVLAASLPEYKLYMDFMSWEKDSLRQARDQHRRDSILHSSIDTICQGMHALFPDIDPVEFKNHLLEGRKKKSHHWLLYKRRVTYIQYRQAKELPLFRLSSNRGGFHVEEIKTRKNPFGKLAIRTIGDLYKGIDSARTGIELSFDSVLRGKPGVAHRQKVLKRYLTIVDKPAEDGCDVMTTLDVGMQDICEKALSDKLTELNANAGVVILMEVATGDIKAMTSLRRMADGSYQEVNADAVKNLYEPGSVFKPMSFLVAMDDGFIHMNDVIDVGCGVKEMYGALMRDANWRSGGSGVVTVPQVLQKSLNVGVSVLIDRAYHDNPRKFVEGLYRIGVAEDLKIPIPGYAKPRIRMPKADGSNWSKTALPWMSIGYETQVPPITTVTFYNALANKGKMLRPRLVKAILKNGEVIREFPVEVLREQMAKPEAVKNICDILESVVSIGTGKRARSKYFPISGKTGTAQIWTKHGFAAQYLVSFAGYFPSNRPLYSCIVCIQKGAPASGGTQCAPVFKRVAETVMAQRRISDYTVARDTLHSLQPVVMSGSAEATRSVLGQLGISYQMASDKDLTPDAWSVCQTSGDGITIHPEAAVPALTVPDVKGYGLRDAVYRLEASGFKVRSQGVGCVSSQSLKPGTVCERATEIVLTLGDPDDIPRQQSPAAAAPDAASAQPNDTAKKSDSPKPATLSPPAGGSQQKPSKPSAPAAAKPKAAPQTDKPKPKSAAKAKPLSAAV